MPDGAEYEERETHRGVEQAPADSEEHPCVNGEGESEREADVEEFRGVLLLHGGHDHSAGVCIGGDVGDLCAGEGEEEEGDCADEFADDGDGVASSCSGETTDEGLDCRMAVRGGVGVHREISFIYKIRCRCRTNRCQTRVDMSTLLVGGVLINFQKGQCQFFRDIVIATF